MTEDMRGLNRFRYLKTFSIAILSFLLGITLTISLTPIDKTCRIDNTEKGYNIIQKSQQTELDLVILILSAPKNLDKRTTIRETWLRLLDNRPEPDLIHFKLKHYFVVGSYGLNRDQVLHMSTEQSIHGDMLILPMYDGYQNLTDKVLQSFHWLNEQHDYGFNYKHVLKCDDDSFVRVDKLLLQLNSIEIKSLKQRQFKPSNFISFNVQINPGSEDQDLELYWGYFNGKARIFKSGKWKETTWIACDRYLPYAVGGGYVLSRNLVSILANNAFNYRKFVSEDVSIGFYLSPITHILRIHDIRFDTEWTTRGCQNYYIITHNISVEEMKKMYENIQMTNELCETELVKRDFYLYDWKLPPSQCCGSKSSIKQ